MDQVDLVPFIRSITGNLDIETFDDRLPIGKHVPTVMKDAYHVHPSLEINFLSNCTMTYSFGDELVDIPSDRFCVFWAARPHRVVSVQGRGEIVTAYVSLQEFWRWSLPVEFTKTLISGAILTSGTICPSDEDLAGNWAARRREQDEQWGRLHLLEIQARLTRMALEGWQVLGLYRGQHNNHRIGGNAIHSFDKMLRFIAVNFTERIGLDEIAAAANVSPNYAIQLFKKVLGITVKSHLSKIRVSHARLLLADTD